MTNLVCIDECAERNEGEDSLLQQLRESDRRLSEAGRRFNKSSMEIGWDGFFIKSHYGWQRLGYEDEKQYREAKKIGRSTWYKMVAIAGGLAHLSREDFLAMTVENAEQLAAQPMSVKQDPALILKAQTETAESFAGSLVAETARRENKPADEVFVTIKWRVKQAQRQVIERGLEDWQHKHGIDDPAYALELMIAEFQDHLTFVGFISEAVSRLGQAVVAAHTHEELEALRNLLAMHVQEMGELLKICAEEETGENAA
jgi:hypothetical protein